MDQTPNHDSTPPNSDNEEAAQEARQEHTKETYRGTQERKEVKAIPQL
jgi:hypothetical protein